MGKLPNVTDHLTLIKRVCLTRAKVQRQTRLALPAGYKQGHTPGHEHNIVAHRINDGKLTERDVIIVMQLTPVLRTGKNVGNATSWGISEKCVEPHREPRSTGSHRSVGEFQAVPNNEYDETFVGSLENRKSREICELFLLYLQILDTEKYQYNLN